VGPRFKSLLRDSSTRYYIEYFYSTDRLLHQVFPFSLNYKAHYRCSIIRGAVADAWTLAVPQEALVSIATETQFDVNLSVFVDWIKRRKSQRLVVSRLAKLGGNPRFKLRLCLASRPENIFKGAFQGCPSFSIHEHTANDIRIYAEGRIEAEMDGKFSSEAEHELKNLIENIIENAQGMFLWVRLVVDELIEGLCEGDRSMS
jgi:hypothetical protein